MANLFNMVKDFYEAGAREPEAQRFLVGRRPGVQYADRTYQFAVEGEAPFYIEIEHGKLSVKEGISAKAGWMDKVDFWVEKHALLEIMKARLNIVDALDSGKWQSTGNEHWRGSHIPVLTRIGQDVVKKKAIE